MAKAKEMGYLDGAHTGYLDGAHEVLRHRAALAERLEVYYSASKGDDAYQLGYALADQWASLPPDEAETFIRKLFGGQQAEDIQQLLGRVEGALQVDKKVRATDIINDPAKYRRKDPKPMRTSDSPESRSQGKDASGKPLSDLLATIEQEESQSASYLQSSRSQSPSRKESPSRKDQRKPATPAPVPPPMPPPALPSAMTAGTAAVLGIALSAAGAALQEWEAKNGASPSVASGDSRQAQRLQQQQQQQQQYQQPGQQQLPMGAGTSPSVMISQESERFMHNGQVEFMPGGQTGSFGPPPPSASQALLSAFPQQFPLSTDYPGFLPGGYPVGYPVPDGSGSGYAGAYPFDGNTLKGPASLGTASTTLVGNTSQSLFDTSGSSGMWGQSPGGTPSRPMSPMAHALSVGSATMVTPSAGIIQTPNASNPNQATDVSMEEERPLAALRLKLEAANKSVAAAFRVMDVHQKGRVSFDDFHGHLLRIGAVPSNGAGSRKAVQLFKLLDIDHDDMLTPEDCVDAFSMEAVSHEKKGEVLQQPDQAPPRFLSKEGLANKREDAIALQQLRRFLTARCGGLVAGLRVMQKGRNDDVLSLEDFVRGLTDLGYCATAEAIDLFRLLNPDGWESLSIKYIEDIESATRPWQTQRSDEQVQHMLFTEAHGLEDTRSWTAMSREAKLDVPMSSVSPRGRKLQGTPPKPRHRQRYASPGGGGGYSEYYEDREADLDDFTSDKPQSVTLRKPWSSRSTDGAEHFKFDVARTARLAQPRTRHGRLSHTIAEKAEIDFPQELRQNEKSTKQPREYGTKLPMTGTNPFWRSEARHEKHKTEKIQHDLWKQGLVESKEPPPNRSISPAAKASRSPGPKWVLEGLKDKDLEEICKETHRQPPDTLKRLMEAVHLILEYEYPPQIEPTWKQIQATFDYDKLFLRIQQQSSAGGGKDHHPELIKHVKNKYFIGKDNSLTGLPLTNEKVAHANRAATGLWRWAAGMIGVEPKLMPKKVSPKKKPKSPRTTSPTPAPKGAARSRSPIKTGNPINQNDPSSPQASPDSFDNILRRHSGQGASALHVDVAALQAGQAGKLHMDSMAKSGKFKKDIKALDNNPELNGFLDDLVSSHPAHATGATTPVQPSTATSKSKRQMTFRKEDSIYNLDDVEASKGKGADDELMMATTGERPINTKILSAPSKNANPVEEVSASQHWQDVSKDARKSLLQRRQSRLAKKADQLQS